MLRLDLPKRLGSLSDPLRLAAQTTAAGVAAFGVARLIGLPTETWAVFSAVFAVQASIGGTVSSALSRLAGGILGLLFALAAIFVIGSGEWRTVASLASSLAAMSLMTGWRPELRYGLVTATILVVNPGFEVVEGAIDKAIGIGVGSLLGTVAAVLLWPRRASSQAIEAAGRALDGCADLFEAWTTGVLEGGDMRLEPIHARIEAALSDSRADAGLSRPERAIGHGGDPERPARAVARLWYTLALLLRLGADDDFPSDVAGRIEPALADLSKTFRTAMRDIAVGDAANRDAIDRALSGLHDVVDSLDDHGELAPLGRRRNRWILTLLFGCEQLALNLRDVDDAFREARGKPAVEENPADRRDHGRSGAAGTEPGSSGAAREEPARGRGTSSIRR